jgi:outer membrane protein assembly factor BamB
MTPTPRGTSALRFLPALLAAAVLLPAATLPLSAEEAASADAVVRAATAAPGFCVHVGCGDGALTLRLAEGSALVVHALDPDAARVAALRDRLQARGLYGQAAVETWALPWLPHLDELANVVVAESPGAVPENELLRILVPGGTAWVRSGTAWRAVRKPRPASYDEWTHARHGADGNMVSRDTAVTVPASVRWVAGPAQDAGGRKWYYDHVLLSASGRNFYYFDTVIAARDAFNGRLLWTREVPPVVFKETGVVPPAPKGGAAAAKDAKPGTRTSKVRPVASGDRLFAIADGQLVALDAATGGQQAAYGPVTEPREILLDGGRLVVSDREGVRAFDAATRARLWSVPVEARCLVTGDGGLWALSGPRLIGLDAATGKERWHVEDPRAAEAQTCSYHGGVLALETSTWQNGGTGCGVLVFSAREGALLWTKSYKTDMTHYKEARAYFAQGLLWLQTEGSKVTGYDPRTGREERAWGSRGKHCSTPVASERYFMSAECEFTDFATGSQQRARMFKSACRLPFIPGNGLLYTFPVQCECYPMLRGYMGLGPAPRMEPSPAPAFAEGPVAGRPAPPPPGAEEADWPVYRHDAWRTGATASALRDAAPAARWSTRIADPPAGPAAAEWRDNPFVRGPLTPPVAAGGLVVVAAPDAHRVAALDAETGRVRWQVTAGGRVDTPPTLAGGLCLFGAHDGWITALDARTGDVAWRYRAAPREGRMAAYGQVESPWPVPGSVLVVDGIAYAAAGRHPMCDGGVRVVALEARTGRRVWEKTVDEMNLKGWYATSLPGTKRKIGLDFEPMDLLVRDGDRVAMSRWRFDPRTGEGGLEVEKVDYQAPGIEVPRGLWGYGIRQTKDVKEKLPQVVAGGKLQRGAPGDVALIVAGGTRVAAAGDAPELRVGERHVVLTAPAVRDGIIVAHGRIYVSQQDGKVACLEPGGAGVGQ